MDARWRRWFWLLFAAKATLSLALLSGYLASPMGASPSLDEESYLAWAQRILQGDGGTFYQDPAYPYLLAGVLKLSSGSHLAARLVNVALGLLAFVWLFRLATRLFGGRHALLACALAMLTGSLALDEVSIGKEPLLWATVVGAALLLVKAWQEGSLWMALAAGLVTGSLTLQRGNFVLLLPLLLVVTWRALSGYRRHLAVAAMLLLPTLAAVRNGLNEGRWWPGNATAGILLYIGNHSGADGTWMGAPFVRAHPLHEIPDYIAEATRRLGHPATLKETGALFLAETEAFVQAHPGEEVALLWRKLRLTLSGEEVPSNQSVTCLRSRFVPALWLAPLRAAWLWPLALVGALALWRRSETQALVFLASGYAATLLLTFVVERYRLPLFLFAFLFAPVVPLSRTVETAHGLKRRRLALGVDGLVLLAVGTAFLVWPVRVASPEREASHCLSLAGASLLAAGRAQEAAPLFDEALALDGSNDEAAYNVGTIAVTAGDPARGAEAFVKVLRHNPRHAEALLGLGVARAFQQRDAEARDALTAFFSVAAADQRSRACASLGEVPGPAVAAVRAEQCQPLPR